MDSDIRDYWQNEVGICKEPPHKAMSDLEVAQTLLRLYGITIRPLRVEMQTWLVRDADGHGYSVDEMAAVMFDKR